MIVVFNPTAGRRRQGRLRDMLAALAARGVVAEVRETAAPGDATRIARAAAAAGAGLVVAAGGDGTIAEVAEGLQATSAQLGILPLGTANVLAHELALPQRPDALAALLAGGAPRWLRPGRARFADGSTRLFVQMLGLGFDAAVVAGLDLRLKRRLGRGAYVLQSLRELPRYPFPPCQVLLDGQAHDAASVIVTKGRLYAGQYLLAPAARPDAPGFHVALFARGGPGQAALAGLALPFGLLPWLPGMTLHRASLVELRPTAAPCQMDGDPAPPGLLGIAEATHPLPVLAPAA